MDPLYRNFLYHYTHAFLGQNLCQNWFRGRQCFWIEIQRILIQRIIFRVQEDLNVCTKKTNTEALQSTSTFHFFWSGKIISLENLKGCIKEKEKTYHHDIGTWDRRKGWKLSIKQWKKMENKGKCQNRWPKDEKQYTTTSFKENQPIAWKRPANSSKTSIDLRDESSLRSRDWFQSKPACSILH